MTWIKKKQTTITPNRHEIDDLTRLDFLDWLDKNNFLNNDTMTIWVSYISERDKKNESV